VFSDRVELRSAVAAADVNDPPRVAELTDPIQRVLNADPDIRAWEVRTIAGVPSSAQLTTATHRIIQFSSTGQASVHLAPTATSITIFIRNAHPGAGTQERNFRIDIAPLTGHVSLVEAW
jgi:hypothetical protein